MRRLTEWSSGGGDDPSLVRRIFIDRWEIWLVLALTSFAGFLRFWHLPVLPYGFHGDEANVTIDSQRILNEGWIGAWSRLSLGYPIAVNYFMAPFVKVFGPNAFGIRLPVAILGTAATPLAYVVFRNVAGPRAAICGTLLMTVSLWHLHLSRMGIPVIGWPTMELATLLCLQYGIKTRKWWWWVGAGLLLGVGLWIYNSVFIFAVAVGIYLAGWLVWQAWQNRDRTVIRDVLLVAILAVCTFFAAKPIIDYQREPGNNYRGRFEQIYIFSKERHDRCVVVAPQQRDLLCRYAVAEGFSQKSDVVWTNMREFYKRLAITGYPDTIDGLGARPPLGKITAYLAIIGVVVSLFRYRTKESVLIGLMTIPALALATSLTLDGQYRRAFGMLPFLALYAGIALGTVWEWADKQRIFLWLPALLLVFGCLGFATNKSLSFYFNDFQDDGNTRFVYTPDARGAWEYLDTLGHPYVYFYNQRGSLNYETRIVLAPHIAGGEDRSREFTTEDKTLPLRYDLKLSERQIQPIGVEPTGVVFVFLGTYLKDVDKVKEKYPGGVSHDKFNEHYQIYDFRAYYLPPELLAKYAAEESVTYEVVQTATQR